MYDILTTAGRSVLANRIDQSSSIVRDPSNEKKNPTTAIEELNYM